MICNLLAEDGFAQKVAKEKRKQDHHIGEVGKGPHGGTVEEAIPYHAEILVDDHQLYVFFLDANAEPMSIKGVSGTAKVSFGDGSIKESELKPAFMDGFIIAIPNAPNYVGCLVTADVNGTAVTARFVAEKAAPVRTVDSHNHQH